MTDKQIQKLGWIASGMSILMYVSYIAQIINNLQGHKGSWVQPAVATVNCTLWTIYALKSTPKQKAMLQQTSPAYFWRLPP